MFFYRKIAARSWNFFCNLSFIHLWSQIVLKTNLYVDKLLDPDPTLVEFFGSGSDIEIKVSDRIRIQRICDPRTSASLFEQGCHLKFTRDLDFSV